MKEKVIYIISVIGALFVGIIGTFAVTYFLPIRTEMVEKQVSNVNITETDTIKSAIAKVYDAVVAIQSYSGGRLISTGTGFVYKKDGKVGYLITNHHVIDGASTIKVINNNGQEVEAKLLGSDAYADLAVLSIDADAVMQVAELGSNSDLEIGDTLFTVGTPLGIEYMGSVTKGILSGKDRVVAVKTNGSDFMMEVLQTDAAMNPGNSGGPLVNINGQVIGVNSLKLVQDQIEGMGFAIPIELVKAYLDRLEKGEEIKRPMLGVTMLDTDNIVALYQNGIQLDDEVTSGVVIVSVEGDSPASKGGLKKGDVILEIDGTKIEDTGRLRFVLYKYSIGDTIKLKYSRDGKTHEVEVNLNKGLEG